MEQTHGACPSGPAPLGSPASGPAEAPAEAEPGGDLLAHARGRVSDLAGVPVDEHVARYAQAHGLLAEALAALDER